MCLHETKVCGRCQSPFECKVGNISQCHCSGVRLTDEERAYLSAHYTGCLCAPCLQAARKEAHFGHPDNRANLLSALQQHR
jgi:hypothetical protein